MKAELPWLAAGDLVFVEGSGWLSKAIRRFTRLPAEPPTRANHVGMIVRGGQGSGAHLLEALVRVRECPLGEAYGGTKARISIFRPKQLPPRAQAELVRAALAYKGRRYGVLKIPLYALDFALSWALYPAHLTARALSAQELDRRALDVYLFRRLANGDRFPVCSRLVAHVFASIGFDFGVPWRAASPDDIFDFCRSEPTRYRCVVPWRRIPR